MITKIEQIRIFSEKGDPQYGDELVVEVDPTKKTNPITFYIDGMPVFSIGSDEVSVFCEQILNLVSYIMIPRTNI